MFCSNEEQLDYIRVLPLVIGKPFFDLQKALDDFDSLQKLTESDLGVCKVIEDIIVPASNKEIF